MGLFWGIVIAPPRHLQCCDLGFHASLARTMRTFLSAEYSLETSRHEGLDLLEGAVDAMDVRGDKLKVMDMHSQIFCPPARFGYQPHMGDEVGGGVVVQDVMETKRWLVALWFVQKFGSWLTTTALIDLCLPHVYDTIYYTVDCDM